MSVHAKPKPKSFKFQISKQSLLRVLQSHSSTYFHAHRQVTYSSFRMESAASHINEEQTQQEPMGIDNNCHNTAHQMPRQYNFPQTSQEPNYPEEDSLNISSDLESSRNSFYKSFKTLKSRATFRASGGFQFFGLNNSSPNKLSNCQYNPHSNSQFAFSPGQELYRYSPREDYEYVARPKKLYFRVDKRKLEQILLRHTVPNLILQGSDCNPESTTRSSRTENFRATASKTQLRPKKLSLRVNKESVLKAIARHTFI